MEMYQVRYFLALSETLNFTRAAEQCHVSQPSLTRAIKGLEDELGGPLFHRERNNTHLTELGRMMLPYLDHVRQQAEAAKAKARDFGKLTDAPLAIGIMCSLGPTRLLDFFSRFREQYPGVSLHLVDARGGETQEMLEKGDVDIAIYGLPEGIDDRFHALKLFDERFIIIVGPEHHFASRPAIRYRELDDEPYLGRKNCEYGRVQDELAAQYNVRRPMPFNSDRDDWLQVMVRAGYGYSFFPEFAVTVDGLVALPMIEPALQRTVNLVTVRGRPHTPAVGAFVREAMRHRWEPELTAS